MIASFHRLTYFWLEPDPGTSWAAPRDFLTGIRSSRVSSTSTEGHICEHYDPEALPSDAPGYIWLRKKLGELASEVPADPGDTPFDAQPSFDPRHPVPERDPFPAFFWTMGGQDRNPWGILEVLVGRDFVVFHQCAMSEVKPGEGDDALRRLEENGWVLRHDSPAALFTAEFIQVSHLDATDRPFWSEKIARFELRSPSSFPFSRDAIEYETRLGISQDSKDGVDIYRGLVLIEQISRDAGSGETPSELHLEATGFVTRLTTLLGNASKVNWENSQAQTKFAGISQEFKVDLAGLDQLQKRRERILPSPLSRSEVGKLRLIYHSARKNLEQVNQLVETCRLNLRQFEDLSRRFLHQLDPWAGDTLVKLRRLVDNLQVMQRALGSRAQWLQEEIYLLLETGGRFASDYVPELLQCLRSPAGRSLQVSEGLSPLVVRDYNAGKESGALTTLWLAGCEQKEGNQNNEAVPLVLRPSEISLDRKEDLTDLYVEALANCSPGSLRHLMESLCNREGHIQLATVKPSPPLPIGKVFTAVADPEFQRMEGTLLSFLDPAFSMVYAQDSAQKDQDWVGMICLLSFIEALIRFLDDAPFHLASIAREYSAARPRLLFLAGFLNVVSGRVDEAKGFLGQATQLALSNQDFDWAYLVAKFFQEYERRVGPKGSQIKQVVVKTQRGRLLRHEELAQEFLKVYDLDSAVSLARASLPSREGRPWRMRGLLWVFAFVVGSALLLADKLAGPTPPHWFAGVQNQWGVLVLVSASALAVLGAPLALWLGARRAMEQLFPAILFPRILGAITLGAIALCASEETEKLVTAKAPIFTMMVVISLAGGIGYLYSEVRKKVSSGAECLRRCFDVFCLAFLEAACLSTAFVLIYEGMFEAAYDKPGYYTMYGVFLRPHNIFLIAILSMFIGIVVQVMTLFSEKRSETNLTETRAS